MPTFGPDDSAEIWVYTFKEGLLSRAAHDLKIGVGSFEITVEGDTIQVKIDATTLRTRAAMVKGVEQTRVLSGADRAEIDQLTRKEVLKTEQFPTIEFRSSTFDHQRLEGDLTLCGQTRHVSASLRSACGNLTAEFVIDQRNFGIRPFKAALGTMRVAAKVRVEATLPDLQ